jgi:hypothetical protein
VDNAFKEISQDQTDDDRSQVLTNGHKCSHDHGQNDQEDNQLRFGKGALEPVDNNIHEFSFAPGESGRYFAPIQWVI